MTTLFFLFFVSSNVSLQTFDPLGLAPPVESVSMSLLQSLQSARTVSFSFVAFFPERILSDLLILSDCRLFSPFALTHSLSLSSLFSSSWSLFVRREGVIITNNILITVVCSNAQNTREVSLRRHSICVCMVTSSVCLLFHPLLWARQRRSLLSNDWCQCLVFLDEERYFISSSSSTSVYHSTTAEASWIVLRRCSDSWDS